MKTDPNSPAFPQWKSLDGKSPTLSSELNYMTEGMTIRAVIAKDLMAGMLANPNLASAIKSVSDEVLLEKVVEHSIAATDALIAQLNK